MDNSSTDGVRAVSRALEVLLAFREDDAALSASDLLARVALSRPTLYRLLYTLEAAGFVRAVGEPQRFRLGPAAGQLARVWAATKEAAVDIPGAAQPMVRALWEATGETVAVFVPENSVRVCVAEQPSAQALSFKRGLGYRENILLGASGRVMLAHMPHTLAVLKVHARSLPPGVQVDLPGYAATLEQAARRGHAVSRSELIQGAVAMAAPFFGADGAVAGSLAVFGPSVRLPNLRVKEICGLLMEQAALLSKALG